MSINIQLNCKSREEGIWHGLQCHYLLGYLAHIILSYRLLTCHGGVGDW